MFDFTALEEITLKLKDEIKKSLSDTITIYELWFESMSVLRMTDKVLLISVNTDIQKLTIESKYKHLLIDAVKATYFGLDLKVGVFYTHNGQEKIKITKEMLDAEERRLILDDIGDIININSSNGNSISKTIFSDLETDEETVKNFKDKYTFNNFVVGSSNRFAYKASLDVAQYPAARNNPFFIWGPPGLGKTHLLCAISNEYAKRFKHMKVLYVNGEDFTNEMVDSIFPTGGEKNPKKAQIFRDKYRNCDMLLIDDIQFIAGRVSTQEEIFHTFNALYEAGKQIIFTSDRPPKDINPLEERIRGRFESGLIVDIQPPDLELRTAILKRKSADMGIKIPNEVLFFLAENISSNIRQIEGAIKKLNAYSYLNNSEITLELAKTCIADILSGTEPINVTVEKVLAAVSQTFGIPQTELKGRKRTKEIAQARNVAMYIIRNITDLSYPVMGKLFGDRNHSTILSAVGVIEAEIETNTILKNQVNDITNIAKG